ncbi:MAG: hypothetical protein D9V44_00825 [Actinobacteria bacterium]|nr:MAG: hypothetical protein D9V44_00825 [Actinomycetota bacterium]
MEEHPPQPTDAAEWARIERRRKQLVWAGIGLAALAAVAAGAWLLFGRAPAATPSATYEPIPGSKSASGTVSVDETASAAATESITATGTPGVVDPAAKPGAATCTVAYRRAGKLCVARRDGSGEVVVADSEDGVFALSPDGRTLAFVDSAKRHLMLVNVATGTQVDAGQAALERPAWPQDSGWCVFTGDGARSGVRRVSKDGTGGSALFAGTSPAVSADGATVVGIRANADGSSAIVAYRGGKAATLGVSGYAVDVAAGPDHVYYAVAADDLAPAEIRSMTFSGGGGVVLRSGPQAGARASFQDLCLSTDGARLAFAEVGDDGYSRLFAVNAADGGAPSSLSVRRDDYPLCWGCDERLYFIEGNAWQGEATKLMAVRGDGTGRTIVVEGARR